MLANAGYAVELCEMRPVVQTPVHKSADFAELVCSNSLKSVDPHTAAGMLKYELDVLGSPLYKIALETAIDAGGALAVNRYAFAHSVTECIEHHPLIKVRHEEIQNIAQATQGCDALLLATGPLTADALAEDIRAVTGSDQLSFYDAAAPIVMADSLDYSKIFRQSRYEDICGGGDYLNCPFDREEYDVFIDALIHADRTILRDFESKDLFQACQPIEEVARTGHDAPRYGAMKPVGLTDPRTGRRPWAAVQLRAENRQGMSYNLVGFQTNLTFPEQQRVFRMIPGLEQAEFVRYGVMHRNTYLNAPQILEMSGRLRGFKDEETPVYVAGQLAGTEGYVEAIRSGSHAAISIAAYMRKMHPPALHPNTAFGALMTYATDPATKAYQPMHVNFGIMAPLSEKIKNKRERRAALATRGNAAMDSYIETLRQANLLLSHEALSS